MKKPTSVNGRKKTSNVKLLILEDKVFQFHICCKLKDRNTV